MGVSNTAVQFIGAVICSVGLAGVFVNLSYDDGALAVAGAVIFSAGVVAQAVSKSGLGGP